VLDNQRAHVLIVDDDPTNIMILQRVLGLDYRISTASSGRDALTLAAIETPDVVLLDVMMPGMDGFETCKAFKASEELKEVLIVFVSALDDQRDEAEGLELGAIDYITKPVSSAIVRARLKNYLELKRARDVLLRLSQVDGLTGIANRRAFDEQFEKEWRRAKRSGESLTVMLMDIDFFKQYNDTYGHIAGDGCLRRVAQVLTDGLGRAGDFVARYGGEEFVCLLPHLDLERAKGVAERLRKSVEDTKLAHESSSVSDYVTISIGLVSQKIPEDGTMEGILGEADKNLYRAKDGGRNLVVSG
jgi:diguanylate cyclase (GGDEF)-like protein